MIGRGGGGRRRRQLSSAERALWDKVVESVTPLGPRARGPEPEPELAPKQEPKAAPAASAAP
ncbi:hypothetical protein ACFQ4O_17240, partial [Methylopila musalis]